LRKVANGQTDKERQKHNLLGGRNNELIMTIETYSVCITNKWSK